MGWVTLTLRKATLKQDHAYYQLRDLQISREKRQLARKKTFETNKILTEQRQMERDLKENYYYQAKTDKETALKKLHDAYNNYKAEKTLTEGNDYENYQNLQAKTGLDDDEEKQLKDYEEQIANNTALLSFSDWEKDSRLNTTNTTTAQITEEYEDAILEYQEKKNELKTDYDQEIAMNEEEVADEELMLDQEQNEIEAQMEAISQELQAVSQAVSQQIQGSTIKLV